MSLKVSGERLLAEALADAMDRDLADVPSGEQLERQHRFSGKFVRRMKRLEIAVKEGREVTDAAGAPGKRIADDRKGAAGQNRSERNRKWGALARQYGVLAAAFVCVVGLVAVVGVTGQSFRMKDAGDTGAPESVAGDSAAADTVAPEDMNDAVSEDHDTVESAADEVMDDAMDDIASDEGETPAAGQTEDDQEITAPGWQEQLLAESEKADELVRWHLNTISDDGSIGLHSEVVSDEISSGEEVAERIFFATAVYEVYFEQSSDDWVCVYRTERMRYGNSEEMSWDEWYTPEDLNMTQAGTYRLVRQVDSYRQVLQLTLDVW